MFDAKKVRNDIVNWIQEWFLKNGSGCNAVVEISGELQSTIVVALCCEAIGNQRVIGVSMPDGEQDDIKDTYNIAKHLDICYMKVNIENIIDSVFESIIPHTLISVKAENNLPERVRKVTLCAVSESLNGKVVNTIHSPVDNTDIEECSPLMNLTEMEIEALAKELGVFDENSD